MPDPGLARGRAAGEPWPAGAALGPGGLDLAGIPATVLGDRYGTPLLALLEEDLRERCRWFRQAFGDVLFAVKAFPSRFVRVAMEEGLGLLAPTGGELEFCLRAGASPELVAMHGSNRSDGEIALAVEAGARFLVVEPGRAVVANPVVTIFRVGAIKEVPGGAHVRGGRRRDVGQHPAHALRLPLRLRAGGPRRRRAVGSLHGGGQGLRVR